MCATPEYASMRLTLLCGMAIRLPATIVRPAIAETTGTHTNPVLPAPSRYSRNTTMKPAALGATDSQATNGVAAASRVALYSKAQDRMPITAPVVHSDQDILSGTPVFVGTRVPAQSLFDYLEGGDTLDEFLRQFPSVRREQAIAALALARDSVLTSARSA